MPAKGNTNARTHGHTGQVGGRGGKVWKSRTYQSWASMNDRCSNPRHKWWHCYGGRGVEVCERWRRGRDNQDAFGNFLEDMGVRPEERTLDRVNVDLGYSKDNCRWATVQEQNSNQQRSRHADIASA